MLSLLLFSLLFLLLLLSWYKYVYILYILYISYILYHYIHEGLDLNKKLSGGFSKCWISKLDFPMPKWSMFWWCGGNPSFMKILPWASSNDFVFSQKMVLTILVWFLLFPQLLQVFWTLFGRSLSCWRPLRSLFWSIWGIWDIGGIWRRGSTFGTFATATSLPIRLVKQSLGRLYFGSFHTSQLFPIHIGHLILIPLFHVTKKIRLLLGQLRWNSLQGSVVLEGGCGVWDWPGDNCRPISVVINKYQVTWSWYHQKLL